MLLTGCADFDLHARPSSCRLRPRFAWLRSGVVASSASTLTLQPYGLSPTVLYTTKVCTGILGRAVWCVCSITLSQHAVTCPLPSIVLTSRALMCKSGATDPSHTYLDVSLADGPVGISSSPGQDLPAISAVIATALQKELASYASYGTQAAVKEGVQAAVAWNFIYTPCEGPILPVRWVHDLALVIVSFFICANRSTPLF